MDRIGIQVSKDTRGDHLGEIKDEIKSMAYTENVQGEDGELFYNNDYAARDKYTEGQQMEKEPSEQESLDELKFFGEDEIQPKNTLDI
mmetsp:Transcript_12402/g.19377  ORF Transcript_12402/g.19377 Transcript_12402/m.19377 type:complete len:88 (+) Transcript_12402:709-972(+)